MNLSALQKSNQAFERLVSPLELSSLQMNSPMPNYSTMANFLLDIFQVKDFVSRYPPAYNVYLPTLYSEGPSGSDPEHLLIEIDEGRNPF
ncbi:hypothetical protein EZV62_004095 [Acer yangbiense]|uniref:Uncharacterized protein n=1 Tax=Acer yangbiense TaxID=1000413 RepID=A0A5C7IIQ2_9ROSI|nr:hypothetical protein EZV62_004095 [Acer yangbiense]